MGSCFRKCLIEDISQPSKRLPLSAFCGQLRGQDIGIASSSPQPMSVIPSNYIAYSSFLAVLLFALLQQSSLNCTVHSC